MTENGAAATETIDLVMCPLCRRGYMDLTNHLKRSHHIERKQALEQWPDLRMRSKHVEEANHVNLAKARAARSVIVATHHEIQRERATAEYGNLFAAFDLLAEQIEMLKRRL